MREVKTTLFVLSVLVVINWTHSDISIGSEKFSAFSLNVSGNWPLTETRINFSTFCAIDVDIEVAFIDVDVGESASKLEDIFEFLFRARNLSLIRRANGQSESRN